MKSKIGIIVSEFFSVSLVTYLILLFLEILDKGFVSNVFDLNILLGVVLVSGVIKVLPIAEKKDLSEWEIIDRGIWRIFASIKPPPGISENEFYYMILISFGGGLLVYLKTLELGKISLVISVITMVIIFLLSYLIFTDQEEEELE